MTRNQINAKIQENNEQIKILQEKNRELAIESLLLCDETQWFTEEKEIVAVRNGRKKEKKEWIIGRVHWKEEFKDEDTGEGIFVDRSQVVRVNGEWQ